MAQGVTRPVEAGVHAPKGVEIRSDWRSQTSSAASATGKALGHPTSFDQDTYAKVATTLQTTIRNCRAMVRPKRVARNPEELDRLMRFGEVLLVCLNK